MWSANDGCPYLYLSTKIMEISFKLSQISGSMRMWKIILHTIKLTHFVLTKPTSVWSDQLEWWGSITPQMRTVNYGNDEIDGVSRKDHLKQQTPDLINKMFQILCMITAQTQHQS